MFRKEVTEVEYQVFAEDDGYAIFREGARYDLVPYEHVRIYIDDDTLLEAYLAGAYSYVTDNLPPEGVQDL
jgi:hypothetical protein